jgi:bifunctional UDP-N-acetylglucosamine pyrophosphorylase/glucosamine-1-phosphate N-acetyltransferase
MLSRRLIPCLDVRDGQVVKGVRFRDHVVMGAIEELAQRYRDAGADELVFYDITASPEGRSVDRGWVERVARLIDIPFCVAGGIRSVEDARAILFAGADKVSVNSPALERPELIDELAEAFGVQCVVVGIDSLRDEDGEFQRIVEQKDASDEEQRIDEVNTGILVAPSVKLKAWLAKLSNDNAQQEYYLTDVIAMAVQDGIPVESAQPAQVWETLGVNSKVQLAELERIYQRNIANALLDQGVTLADPNRVDVRGVLRCGRDVSIDIGCVFEGEVALGDGVSIGANCVIRDAKIDRGVTIKAFSHIDGATIGADAQIGPYARLRPGTELGADVHVGNFVEIKNSQFDAHSKANHLAYVGDATVGARVNIGAGTITCNYDGANKHRTVIEDDAFIGSDTQLVAPVTVGKGATLGAGTTLTKDAPPDSLTVSRAKQISITGWQRPVKTKK